MFFECIDLMLKMDLVNDFIEAKLDYFFVLSD